MTDTGAPLAARLSDALRRTHPRLLAETLATLDAARPATDPAGLDVIVDELMDMVDWTGTGDRLSGRRERRKYEARITAARSRPATGPGPEPVRWPRWECSSCHRNANQCGERGEGYGGACCRDCDHDR